MNPLVVIVGPTAVGKSALAVDLAQRVDGEIISGDSVQIYRHLNIGSAKPTVAEQKNIPHHLMDILDPAEPFSVAQFQTLAKQTINEIRTRRNVPIVVGGTGLYIRSVLDPFSFPQGGGTTLLKQKWLDMAKLQGNDVLYRILQSKDSVTAARLHPNDTARIVRALEVMDLSGQPLSAQRQMNDFQYFPLGDDVIYIGLTAPREILYARIDRRCEIMFKEGLVEEVLSLLRDKYSPHLKPLQSIGYRHAIWFVRGLLTSWELERLLKRDTRRFAKRQLTWFRRDPRLYWYDISQISWDSLVAEVITTCRARQTRVK